MLETCMAMIHVKQLLEFIGDGRVKMPMTLKVADVGAVYYLANNATSLRTCHIDTRYHYL